MRTFRQFFTEIKDEELDHHLGSFNIKREMKDFPFKHLFNNKLRLVLPLRKGKGSSEYRLERDLEREGYTPDLGKGLVYQTVKTKRGTTERATKIGKILQRLSKKDNIWKDWLHWWEKNKKDIGKVGKTGISIIISQSPIDIIRMSDFDEWQSCHAPPGKRGHISRYWPSAGQEGRTGGAIAYVVKNSDLEDIDLQDEEIFEDPQRDIEGIEPLERLRLRRFTAYKNSEDQKDGKNGIDILVPEQSTYGIKHIDFQETVLDWARRVQRNIINDPPDWEFVDLKGGSYQDTHASTLWNDFLGKHVAWSKKETVDQQEEDEHASGSAESIESAADESYESHKKLYKHISVTYEVEEGDTEPYLWFDGHVPFEFNERDFIKVPTEEDLRQRYSHNAPRTLGNELVDDVNIYNIEDVGVADYQDKIVIYFTVHGERGSIGTVDDFESFLDDLDKVEENYGDLYNKVRQILVEEGFLKEWFSKWENAFQNFTIDDPDLDDYAIDVISDPIYMGDLVGINPESIRIKSNQQIQPKEVDELHVFLQGLNKIFPQKYVRATDEKGNPTNISISVYTNAKETTKFENPIKHPYHYVYLVLRFRFDTPEKERLMHAVIKHIDNNWNIYKSRAFQFWKGFKQLLQDAPAGDLSLGRHSFKGVMPDFQSAQDKFDQSMKKLPTFPKRTLPKEKQLKLPFMDWFIIDELPDISSDAF